MIVDRLAPLTQRLHSLPRHERAIIEGSLKKLAGIERLREDSFLDLGRSLLTAWEGGRLKDLIADVAASDDLTSDEFLSLLIDASALTALHTLESVRAKLLIIQGLEQRISGKELELDLRDYIAEHPWLISPEWETYRIEKRVSYIIEAAAKEAKLNDVADWQSRIDLVLSSGDTMVILEFMRPGVTLDWDHLSRFRRYVTTVRTRVTPLTGGPIRSVKAGYIIADNLTKSATNVADIQDLETHGMYAMD